MIHAAREAQGMLMERRKELERLLTEVSGTAFENARDKVGMGTFVTLRLENGETGATRDPGRMGL